LVVKGSGSRRGFDLGIDARAGVGEDYNFVVASRLRRDVELAPSGISGSRGHHVDETGVKLLGVDVAQPAPRHLAAAPGSIIAQL
jgi:hypothetical protein